jgi:hypothetical protein
MKNNYLIIIALIVMIAAGCEKDDTVYFEEMKPWEKGTELLVGVDEFSMEAHNGFLYIIGGVKSWDEGFSSDIQRTQINTDGSLGNWEVISNLPAESGGHQSFIYNNNLYVFGGCLANSIYTPINNDGSLGNWNNLSSFLSGTWSFSNVLYNETLYGLGGRVSVEGATNLVSTNTIYCTEILENNEFAQWKPCISLTSKRDYLGSIGYKGYIYTFGGHYSSMYGNTDKFYDDVETAKINDDGTLESWVSQTSLPNEAHSITPIVYNDKIYLLTRDFSNIIFADLKENGQIGEWKTSTSEFPATVHHSSCIYGKFVYVIGGILNNNNGTGAKSVFYTSFLD